MARKMGKIRISVYGAGDWWYGGIPARVYDYRKIRYYSKSQRNNKPKLLSQYLNEWIDHNGRGVPMKDLTLNEIRVRIGWLEEGYQCYGQAHKIVTLERIAKEKANESMLMLPMQRSEENKKQSSLLEIS